MALRDILAGLARGAATGFDTYLALEDRDRRRRREDADDQREQERLDLYREQANRADTFRAYDEGFRPVEEGIGLAGESGVRQALGGTALDMGISTANAIGERFAEPGVAIGDRRFTRQPDLVTRETIEQESAVGSAKAALDRANEEIERNRRRGVYGPLRDKGAIDDVQMTAVVEGANPAMLDDRALIEARGDEARTTKKTVPGKAPGSGSGPATTANKAELARLQALEKSLQAQLLRYSRPRAPGRPAAGKEKEHASTMRQLEEVTAAITRLNAGALNSTGNPALRNAPGPEGRSVSARADSIIRRAREKFGVE